MENLVKKIAEGLDTEEEEKQTLAGVDDSLNSFKIASRVDNQGHRVLRELSGCRHQ